jgi:hypothetical protein
MKKLRLDVEQLCVESFEPATTHGERGTVIGQQQSSGDFACLAPCVGPLPTGPIACPEPRDTFDGPGCYRITGDQACYEWTDAGSTC